MIASIVRRSSGSRRDRSGSNCVTRSRCVLRLALLIELAVGFSQPRICLWKRGKQADGLFERQASAVIRTVSDRSRAALIPLPFFRRRLRNRHAALPKPYSDTGSQHAEDASRGRDCPPAMQRLRADGDVVRVGRRECAQCAEHFFRGLEPVRQVFREKPRHDVIVTGGQLGPQAGNAGGFGQQNLATDFHCAVPGEGGTARQALEEDRPEREEIASAVDRAMLELLEATCSRAFRQSGPDLSGWCECPPLHRLPASSSGECGRCRSRRACGRPDGVMIMFCGLRSRWMTPWAWAVRSASAMSAASASAARGSRGPRRKRSASVSPSTNCMTMYGAAVGSSRDLMHAADERMVERRCGLRLADESARRGCVADPAQRDELDRNIAVEREVAREEDGPHTARAKRAHKLGLGGG